MPFSFSTKSQGDLIRSVDWNAAMQAIVDLFERLNGTTGHTHSGSPEEGPQIGNAGIQNGAVDTNKIAPMGVMTSNINDGAVTNAKLDANAVNTGNIIDFAVNNMKLALNSVGTGNIMDFAVDNTKLGLGAVTADKIAPGTIQEFGFATAALYDGMIAPVPTGFQRSECIYHWGIKYIEGSFSSSSNNLNSNVHPTTGLVSIGSYDVFAGTYTSAGFIGSYVHVLTIAKKGGW